MTISPNKVKPGLKEKIIAYQRECDEILWQYWSNGGQAGRGRPAAHPAHAQQALHPADTPPAEPLVFEYEGQRFRVAVRGGEPWFYAQDMHYAAHARWYTPEPWDIDKVPKPWRSLLPGAGGEGNVSALSVPGMAHYFGHNTGMFDPPMIDHILEEVLPSIRRRPGSAAAGPEFSLLDPLCAVFAEFVRGRMRFAGHGKGGFEDTARLLAWLWREGGDGRWLEVEYASGQLAGALQTSRRSLGRALACVQAWRIAEGDMTYAGGPEPEDDGLPDDTPPHLRRLLPQRRWPDRLRLLPENLRAALAEAGLRLPGEAP